MSAAVLYTPEVLALATSLADHRWDADLPLQAEARSRSCGSTIALGLDLDDEGRIARIGVRNQACAIGQAATAIFVAAAPGMTLAELGKAADAIERWLAGGPMPDWPGLSAIAAAAAYPGRHGALALPWRAATQLLSSEAVGG